MTNAVCFRSFTKDKNITNALLTGSGCLGVPPHQTMTKTKNGKTAFLVASSEPDMGVLP